LIDLAELDQTVFLTGRAAEIGRISLALPNGQRLLDAHLDGNGRIALALPKQRGMYVQKGDEEAEIEFPANVVAISQLQFKALRSSARGTVDRTLRAGLFNDRFTVEYYRGFVDSQGVPGVDFSRKPRELPARESVRSDDGEVAPWVSTALLVTAGVALATAAVTFGLALDAKSEFDETPLQRRAHDLNDTYSTLAGISIAAAAAGVASGIGAFLVWPSDDHGNVTAGVQVGGSF
jgi:hypothetical protein